jgi:hypothetical protein
MGVQGAVTRKALPSSVAAIVVVTMMVAACKDKGRPLEPVEASVEAEASIPDAEAPDAGMLDATTDAPTDAISDVSEAAPTGSDGAADGPGASDAGEGGSPDAQSDAPQEGGDDAVAQPDGSTTTMAPPCTPAGDGTHCILLSQAAMAAATVAVDNGTVFWSYNGGGIMSVPVGGGTVSTVAANRVGVQGLAAQSGRVYWSEQGPSGCGSYTGGIFSVSEGGGAVSALTYMPYCAYEVLFDGNIFYSDPSSEGQGIVELAGTTGTTLASNVHSVGSGILAVGGGMVLYTGGPPLGIYGIPLGSPTDGGSAISIPPTSGATIIAGMAAQGNDVYWADLDLSNTGRINTAPLTGPNAGVSTPLYGETGNLSPVAVDDTRVYFGSVDSQTLLAVPLGGGQTETLATGVEVSSIATDANNVYFTSFDGWVMQRTKP